MKSSFGTCVVSVVHSFFFGRCESVRSVNVRSQAGAPAASTGGDLEYQTKLKKLLLIMSGRCLFQLVPKTRHCRRCWAPQILLQKSISQCRSPGDKCVAGFDHHCLWLNTAGIPTHEDGMRRRKLFAERVLFVCPFQCIGVANYRPWVVFVVSLCLWSILSCPVCKEPNSFC